MSSSSPSPGRASADHLCVLVHGLWGHPDHLKYLTTSLREKYPEDQLHILVAKSNTGPFTYDGIELGGERVVNEIEETLENLTQDGHQIKKISVVGYSLGGLINRYAIGLLYHKGWFDKIQPVNFTTFASPHLGVRTPLLGYHNHLWNILGARTLSVSGRQLFTIDKFRDTGRPLLAVLADPGSIFMKALAQFQHRSLYANIINDRSAPYYTTGIVSTDPFVDLDKVNIHYLPGTEDVILDPDHPVEPKEQEAPLAFTQRLSATTRTVFGRLPMMALLAVVIPLGTTAFLFNSAIQSVRSSQRIRLHEQGKAGIDIGGYRIPLMLKNVRKEVQNMFEDANNAESQEYLPGQQETGTEQDGPEAEFKRGAKAEQRGSDSPFPTLALTPDQFGMIQALNEVGIQKFLVHIHKHNHSHAAIIKRYEGKNMTEGRIVVKHWLDNFIL